MKKVYVKFNDKHKIAFRSCWECNEAHKYLKEQGTTFCCLFCGKTFHDGKECELVIVMKESENYGKAVVPKGFETVTFVLKSKNQK